MVIEETVPIMTDSIARNRPSRTIRPPPTNKPETGKKSPQNEFENMPKWLKGISLEEDDDDSEVEEKSLENDSDDDDDDDDENFEGSDKDK